MNSWLFLSLFTAHLVGDFYCQNDKLCRQKEAFKIKSRFLYAHSLIIDSDTDRTEYVLVGTLLSFGIAIAVGLIMVKVRMQ